MDRNLSLGPLASLAGRGPPGSAGAERLDDQDLGAADLPRARGQAMAKERGPVLAWQPHSQPGGPHRPADGRREGPHVGQQDPGMSRLASPKRQPNGVVIAVMRASAPNARPMPAVGDSYGREPRQPAGRTGDVDDVDRNGRGPVRDSGGAGIQVHPQVVPYARRDGRLAPVAAHAVLPAVPAGRGAFLQAAGHNQEGDSRDHAASGDHRKVRAGWQALAIHIVPHCLYDAMT
jgi:hypothetical protein